MAAKTVSDKSRRKKAVDAGDVTRHFFLNSISLWECSLTRDSEFRWGEHTTENCTTQTFRSVEPSVIEAAVEDSSSSQVMLRALVKLGVRIVPDSDIEKPIYTFEATFCADYFILTPPPEELFQHFVEFNCLHNVWPFWRQRVFDTMQQAGLLVPSVPLFPGQGQYRSKRVAVSKVLASAETERKANAEKASSET